MGIQLDWEVESRQSDRKQKNQVAKTNGTRRFFSRLFLVFALFIVILLVVGLFIVFRLNEVQNARERLLTSTVEAEVAALRLGDRDTFINFQRSATDDWIRYQDNIFNSYQNLKIESNTQLTGNVVNVDISDKRARVLVEEIIDGVPYTQAWFYWEYQDGWHHVPPDFTFWGETKQIENERFTIQYEEVDERFATSLSDRLDEWYGWGCSFLPCEGITPLKIDIQPQPMQEIVNARAVPSQFVIESPYVRRARSDMPFDIQYQIEVATLLAEQLVNHIASNIQTNDATDAGYLRSAIISWLVGRMIQIDTESYLISSLVQNYGEIALAELLQNLELDTGIDILTVVTESASLADANLDWRDFLTWRLQLEQALIAIRDEQNWRSLYDTRDESLMVNAVARFNGGGATEEEIRVVRAQLQSATGSVSQLRATVQIGSGDIFREEIVLFNLVNNRWLRAS